MGVEVSTNFRVSVLSASGYPTALFGPGVTKLTGLTVFLPVSLLSEEHSISKTSLKMFLNNVIRRSQAD